MGNCNNNKEVKSPVSQRASQESSRSKTLFEERNAYEQPMEKPVPVKEEEEPEPPKLTPAQLTKLQEERLIAIVYKYLPQVLRARKFETISWFKQARMNHRKDMASDKADEIRMLQEQLQAMSSPAMPNPVAEKVEEETETRRRATSVTEETAQEKNPYNLQKTHSADETSAELETDEYDRKRAERAAARQKRREEELARLMKLDQVTSIDRDFATTFSSIEDENPGAVMETEVPAAKVEVPSVQGKGEVEVEVEEAM